MVSEHNITIEGITNFLGEGALLRTQGEWKLICGPFQSAEYANNSEISVFCPEFYDLESDKVLCGTVNYQLSTSELKIICEEFLRKHPLPEQTILNSSWEEPNKDSFLVALNTIQNLITQKKIKKAVPAVFEVAKKTISLAEKAQLILNLLETPESMYVYGFWRASQGVIGATPELLFSYQDGRLKTMALAGTCPKSEKASRPNLLEDPKELLEHQLVVEDITQILSQWGQVERGETHVLELPSLFHLKTDIEVLCAEPPDFEEVLRALHPTPALGVSPREFDYKFMKGLPGQEGRSFFGGPFLFIQDTKEALCLVGIRNLQWNGEHAMIGSGCGVVAASVLDREWEELFQKRLSVKKILGLKL